jgi:tetratricopeptide (TPR) repeat protein
MSVGKVCLLAAHAAILSTAATPVGGVDDLLQGQSGGVNQPALDASRAGGNFAISVGHLAHKPSKAAVEELNRALREIRKGLTDEAIHHLNEAARLDPGFWEAQVQLADLYWHTGDKAAALHCLEAAIAIDANSEILQSDKAVALLDLGRPLEAEMAAQDRTKIEPCLR